MTTPKWSPCPAWCAGEYWCPITTTATTLGGCCHPAIIHRLLEDGPRGFNDLETEVDGISSVVRSDSLEDLEERDPVCREIVNEKLIRVGFSLADRGESTRSLIYAMRDRGRAVPPPGGRSIVPDHVA